MTNTFTSNTVMFHNDSLIEVVAYSFSPLEQKSMAFTENKIYLDILFVHPRTSETISLRVITQAHLLCKSKDEIEQVVYREIRSALSFSASSAM